MNTTAAGNSLEGAIHDLLGEEINAGRFFVSRECCKLFRRKGYHSKDRGKDIVFDVSIEVYLPDAPEYSLLILVECKNYNHSVPVDDVEEFFAKVQQISPANTKAIVASSAAFQSGARTFAKSKGIGLIRYFDAENFKWELRRSPSATTRTSDASADERVVQGLTDQTFVSSVFDLYLQTPSRETNALWDFVEDILLDSTLTPIQTKSLSNPRSRLASQVPFREKDQLETLASETLQTINYSKGRVSLEAICALEHQRSNLVVKLNVVASSAALGRICFDPLEIEIFTQTRPNEGRERFTLAHELAHHLLGHSGYMSREYCEESDFDLARRGYTDGTDISRMEFQANYYAACLLMPREVFIRDFRVLLRYLEISDRGFGPLYVDDQRCNQQNLGFVTGKLMDQYGVSRSAATIRLVGLGLLKDARGLARLGELLS
jgi:Zn-dependent peptidase ImmA (M78 family)